MTDAFNTGVDKRDKFLERKRWVICGVGLDVVLQRTHIIGQEEPKIVESKMHLDPSEATSGPISDSENVVGCLHEPHGNLNMTCPIAYFCA